MKGWREVTKGEFFEAMRINVHPRLGGQYPYTSNFVTPDGEVKGKAIDYIPDGEALPRTRYMLPNAAVSGSRHDEA